MCSSRLLIVTAYSWLVPSLCVFVALFGLVYSLAFYNFYNYSYYLCCLVYVIILLWGFTHILLLSVHDIRL